MSADKPKYPECEKLKAASEKSQACGEFLGWLGETKGYHLAADNDNDELRPLRLVSYSMETLLAEFFGIDMAVVETERQAMIDDMRKSQG